MIAVSQTIFHNHDLMRHGTKPSHLHTTSSLWKWGRIRHYFLYISRWAEDWPDHWNTACTANSHTWTSAFTWSLHTMCYRSRLYKTLLFNRWSQYEKLISWKWKATTERRPFDIMDRATKITHVLLLQNKGLKHRRRRQHMRQWDNEQASHLIKH